MRAVSWNNRSPNFLNQIFQCPLHYRCVTSLKVVLFSIMSCEFCENFSKFLSKLLFHISKCSVQSFKVGQIVSVFCNNRFYLGRSNQAVQSRFECIQLLWVKDFLVTEQFNIFCSEEEMTLNSFRGNNLPRLNQLQAHYIYIDSIAYF